MTSRSKTHDLLPLLREFGSLERKRVGSGVTPLEYQRWLDLQKRMQRAFPQGHRPDGVDRRRSTRATTRMLAEFENFEHLREAVIENVSRGGVFVSTPFAAEIGTDLILRIFVEESGERVDIPCEVVSNNVGNDFTTEVLGMGLKFKGLTSDQLQAVRNMFQLALGEEAENARTD